MHFPLWQTNVVDQHTNEHDNTNRRDHPSTTHVVVQGLRVVLDQDNEAKSYTGGSVNSKTKIVGNAVLMLGKREEAENGIDEKCKTTLGCIS